MYKPKKIFATLPVLNEYSALPALIDCLKQQDYGQIVLIVCVNNYDSWWNDPEKVHLCEDNEKSLAYLNLLKGLSLVVIDRSSKGLGWPAKKGGVGWARKVAMDTALSLAGSTDIIACIDADTYYPEEYFSMIINAFQKDPLLDAVSIPYYHKLTEENTDRLILRYEIYMRTYLINLLKINNPYAFTALGSAMAVTTNGYKKTGGLTPVKSGEDFYFLQKVVKIGKLGIWTDSIAYPSSRFSDRVLFGTGPALIKGNRNEWGSYPIYDTKTFQKIELTFNSFGELYKNDIKTPMDEFLKSTFKTENLWQNFRENYKDSRNFINACIRKVDGLRILQFLRKEQEKISLSNEECLIEFLIETFDKKELFNLKEDIKDFSFENSTVDSLNRIRDLLYEKEMMLRKEFTERSLYHVNNKR